MPATFAAYVPVCTSCFTAKPSSRTTATPYQQLPVQMKQQAIVGGGIIILICLAGFLFLTLTDRR